MNQIRVALETLADLLQQQGKIAVIWRDPGDGCSLITSAGLVFLSSCDASCGWTSKALPGRIAESSHLWQAFPFQKISGRVTGAFNITGVDFIALPSGLRDSGRA